MACQIRNAPDESNNFKHTAESAGYTAWTMYKLNDTIVIAGSTVTVGKEVVLYYWCPKVLVDCLTITSGNQASYDEGCKVYFDSLTNAITHTSSATTTLCGIVTLQPAVGAVLCEIHLMGALGIVS